MDAEAPMIAAGSTGGGFVGVLFDVVEQHTRPASYAEFA